MFKYYSSYTLVFFGFTHFICCGIPFFLGLSSLFSNLLLLETSTINFEFLEIIENFLFALTSLLFLLLISTEFYTKKISCAKDEDCCTEKECDTTQRTVKFNIILASILYILNSSLFLSEILL